MLKHKAVRSITLPSGIFAIKKQLKTREAAILQVGSKGSYDAGDMLLSQSAAIRPVEMRNKPH